MLSDDHVLHDAGESGDGSFMAYEGLAPGDMVFAKVTIAAQTQHGDAWFTAGAQSTVLQNESADGAFARVSEVLAEKVLDLGNIVGEAVEQQIEDTREAARSNRIVARR